jgi:hypothetical protein
MAEALIQLPARIAFELTHNALWRYQGRPQHHVNVRLSYVRGINRPLLVLANLLDGF